MKANEKKEMIESAKKELLEQIQKGDTIYLILKHTSRNGMYRVFDLLIANEKKEIKAISGKVSNALDLRYDRNHLGVGVTGVGMDMGFYIVNMLSSVLFDNADALRYSHI